MPNFRIINRDQGNRFEHFVTAIDKEQAIKKFNSTHYRTVIECEEIKEHLICPHCGEEIEE